MLSRKGQITVPSEIRKTLGLHQGDKVAFTVEEDAVRLRPAGSVVERTAGMLKRPVPLLTAEQLREAAEQAIAEDVTQRGG
ncbi:MAG: AbrB/MazE/SpoVT family DNA-binding domain-containing protein [Chloroflexota bacterium]|nr:AbrB/MazE/SpoVT family DNA-binding domain-containing protein [Chloroflexota bacterium]